MLGSARLRGDGGARRAMMATIAGGIVNAILDPILIFTFDLGLTGAAWASFVARVVIAYTALMPIVRHYGGIAMPRPAGLWRDLMPVLSIAVPAILTQVATPVGQEEMLLAINSPAGSVKDSVSPVVGEWKPITAPPPAVVPSAVANQTLPV